MFHGRQSKLLIGNIIYFLFLNFFIKNDWRRVFGLDNSALLWWNFSPKISTPFLLIFKDFFYILFIQNSSSIVLYIFNSEVKMNLPGNFALLISLLQDLTIYCPLLLAAHCIKSSLCVLNLTTSIRTTSCWSCVWSDDLNL